MAKSKISKKVKELKSQLGRSSDIANGSTRPNSLGRKGSGTQHPRWNFLVGGGSGGHVVPNKVVAQELLRRDADSKIVVVVNHDYFQQTLKIYKELLESYPDNLVVAAIRSGKFRRYGLGFFKEARMIRTQLLNIRDFFYAIVGYFESKVLLRRYPPAVILCKGGGAALEFCYAARGKAPIVVHDSDSRPGLANKTIAKWAQRTLTGLDQSVATGEKNGKDLGNPEQSVSSQKTEQEDDLFYDKDGGAGNKYRAAQINNSTKDKEVVGIPIDPSFKKVTAKEKKDLKEFLGFKKSTKVVLVLGGSLGAQKINKIIFKILPSLNSLGITTLHQVGNREEDFLKAKRLKAKLATVGLDPDLYQPFKFSFNLPELYAASDIVIARAGATTIQELANTETPAILIPANLTDQKLNVRLLKSREAVLIADQEDLLKSPQKLAAQVELTLDDDKALQDLSKNIGSFAKRESAKVVVDILLQEKNS